jgi:hypothetical protein
MRLTIPIEAARINRELGNDFTFQGGGVVWYTLQVSGQKAGVFRGTSMLTTICQIIIALGIFNVWLIRANQPTAYRGGAARTLKEEFETYGLPLWFMEVVRFLKLSCATLLLVGVFYPTLTFYGAVGMAVLMLGAVAMHAKVKDEIKKTAPAAAMLLLSLLVALGVPS